jgi:diadenosine tetraphosphate (Ap4A) HIT family hydrolase
MSEPFVLHQQLHSDTALVAELPLCRCLLMNDARYPWLILVPRIADLREFHDVPREQRTALYDEIDLVSQALLHVCNPHKLNVAALGNQVPQLHIHVIARQMDDPAWPGPVWGVGSAQAYSTARKNTLLQQLNDFLTA